MAKAGKKILVTGGCGFIGSHTVVSLIENGFEPVIVDTLENSEAFILENMQELAGKPVRFFKQDCTHRETLFNLFEAEKFDGVIHFAAYKAVGESVQQPLKYYHNNIQSLVVVLDACHKYKVNDFIFSSSCTVYGNPDSMPVTEETPWGVPESPYGFSKQVCERMVTEYSTANPGFRAVVLRYFNPIGSHPSALIGELPVGVPNNLVPYITQTAIGKRRQLTIFGNDYDTPDGTCMRDYIHVCDLADAHVQSLAKIDTLNGFPVLFNLGTGRGNSVMEVVTTFERVSGQKLNYIIGPRRSGDVGAIYADTQKALALLGWQCKYTLADALLHSWQWENKYPAYLQTT